MSKQKITCVLCLVGISTHLVSNVFAAPPPLVPGNLLVFDSQSAINEIIEIDPKAGTQSVWESGGFLQHPTDMAFDGSGNVIVSDLDSGIIRINIATGQQTQVASGNFLTAPVAINVGNAGNYIALDVGTSAKTASIVSANAVSIDAQTGSQTLLSAVGGSAGLGDLSDPVDSALDPIGNIFVSNLLSPSIGGETGILKIDANSGSVSVVSSGGSFGSQVGGGVPQGIMFNPDNPQDLWVTDKSILPSASSLLNVDAVTGQQAVISAGGLLQNPGAIAADGADILVFNAAQLSSQPPGILPATIVGVDPLTGSQTLIYSYSDDDLNAPQAILVIPEPASMAILFGVALLTIRRRNARTFA
jgi:sugar lactone lactonase YvrE